MDRELTRAAPSRCRRPKAISYPQYAGPTVVAQSSDFLAASGSWAVATVGHGASLRVHMLWDQLFSGRVVPSGPSSLRFSPTE